MLPRVLEFSLHHRVVIIFAVLAMAVAGIWSFTQLKLEAYPDISDPGVVVITARPGVAADEVEEQVTAPNERALNNTPNGIGPRSRTQFGPSIAQATVAHTTTPSLA